MASSSETSNPWGNLWRDTQQQYWQAWQRDYSQLFEQIRSQTEAGRNPWHEAMQQWEQLLLNWTGVPADDVQKCIRQLGKQYLSVGEAFWEALQQAGNVAAEGRDWRTTLIDSFKQMQRSWSLAPQAWPTFDPWDSSVATLWQMPIDTWTKVARHFAAVPGAMNFRAAGATDAAETDLLSWWLSVPPVGYTREWQSRLQQWGDLSLQYLRAVQDYMLVLGDVSKRAIELLGEKIGNAIEQKKPLKGLREIYNLWVDSGEEAYAEFVLKPEFSNLQAQQVNALMRLKQHEQRMLEQLMTALNMPTRAELDTTHRRVHELRRELRNLESKLESLFEARETNTAKPAKAPSKRRGSRSNVGNAPNP